MSSLREESRKQMEAFRKEQAKKLKKAKKEGCTHIEVRVVTPKRCGNDLIFESIKDAKKAAENERRAFDPKEEYKAMERLTRSHTNVYRTSACPTPAKAAKEKKPHKISNRIQVVIVEDECADFKKSRDEGIQLCELTKKLAVTGAKKSRAKPKSKPKRKTAKKTTKKSKAKVKK